MTDKSDKTTELHEIYTPLFENIVVEYVPPSTKTKAGIELHGQAAKDYQAKNSFLMKVIAIGNDVKSVKIGNYVIPYPYFKPNQVPLLYRDATKGVQHMQFHVSEVMGIVDTTFAVASKVTETKETIN